MTLPWYVSCSQSAMGSFHRGIFAACASESVLEGNGIDGSNCKDSQTSRKETSIRMLACSFLGALGLEVRCDFSLIAFFQSGESEARKKAAYEVCWLDVAAGGIPLGFSLAAGRRGAKGGPIKNFCELITALYWQGLNVVTFCRA